MDRWLVALADDRAGGLTHDEVVDAKPTDLVDGCWTPAGVRVDEPASAGGVGSSRCNNSFPVFGDTRTSAGAPLANDVYTCQREPLDRQAYAVEFTDAQWQRLSAVFAGGVCDWEQPGVGERELRGVWQDFTRTSRA